MFKHNKLFLIVCLSVNSSLFAALKQDLQLNVTEEIAAESQILRAIKIEDAAKIEEDHKLDLAKTSKTKSILAKALLAAQSMGAGAVSLLCGACFIGNTVSGYHYMAGNSAQTLSDKLSGIVRCVGGAAGFVLGSYFAYEYSRDSLNALKSGA